ncbi:Putative ATP-dependent helicase [Tolypocladium paradoxum]|uniref:ATP-dependent helicase n=1 Tax=Tolypocladium paradoxum TaxID=94208 RepID=A0A2S4LAV8_9HYPO|nr:Putative ATP-dependent helicase [Tolypocladium paradoxum]
MDEPQHPGGLASPSPTPDTESSTIQGSQSNQQHNGDTTANCQLTVCDSSLKTQHFEQERDPPSAPPDHGRPHKLAHEQHKEEAEDTPTSIPAYAPHQIKVEVKLEADSTTVALPLPTLDEDEDDFGLDQTDDTGGCDQNESVDDQGCDSSEGESESYTDSERPFSDSEFEAESSSDDKSIRSIDKRRRHGKSSKSKQPAGKKLERRPRAKNARERVARLHQAEDEAAEKKRKRGLQCQRAGGNKKRATNNLAVAAGALSHVADEQEDDDNASATAPPMKVIKATTHAEQLALMKQNIPAGSDTRRTMTQNKDLKEAVGLFGYKRVTAVDGNWRLNNMHTALKSHQITAAAWMVKRELGRAAPYGGLLADVMGLGKTVMSLACMTGNPPQKGDGTEFCRTTLVVVPNKSVALQWKDEVQKHCKGPIGDWASVYNPKDDKPLGMYKKIQVLITTYHELTTEYPSAKFLAEMEDRHDGDEPSFRKAIAKKMGFLFKTKWYRVILDEAHAIKNINSRTAKVCCELISKYRWALSGTPLANSVLELFPYLKFIRCGFTESLWDFKQQADTSFEALISMIMYRRTLKDNFLGCRILDLPSSQHQDIWIPLSREETVIATIREQKKMRQTQGNSEKSVTEPELSRAETRLQYAMSMRLRQSVSHPFNLEKMLRTTITTTEIRELKAIFGEFDANDSILDQMMANEKNESGLERYQTGLTFLRQRKEPVFGGMFEWNTVLDMFQHELEAQNFTCCGCEKATPPVRPVQLEMCGHYYCGDCYLDALHHTYKANAQKRDSIPDRTCLAPDCTKSILNARVVTTLQHITHDATILKFREPGRDANEVQIARDEAENGCFIASARLDNWQLVPSTKLTATMAVLATWLQDYPGDKIIVFVQFVMTGKVLGRMLEMSGHKSNFLYYFGGMSQPQRNKSLKDFKEDSAKRILVASMQCGGQSLNLTVANRVILVDPWWNTAAEQQAFGRVLRIGQEKKSHLVRIMISASIDTKMSSLQRVKSEEIDHALQDDGHVPLLLDDASLQKMFAPRDFKPRKKKTSKTKK